MTKTFKQLEEGYTDQQIKQAYGILNDPRYKGGNYSGAVKAIEKLAKGLSDHPDVANALRRANEEAPTNATGTAVAGTGDDSSTVLVKKRKELQKRLLSRFAIKETLDKILPDPVEKEDEITTRKNQLKELAKNRNV